jgi:pimeloyl-ACP methyl ester carboxylesterase
MSDEKMWQRANQHVYFKNEDADVLFQIALSYQKYGGAEFGECFTAASQMKDGDAETWACAWLSLGKRLTASAETALASKHRVSARECFLRAFTAYRFALSGLHPTDPRSSETYFQMVASFRTALPLLDHPIEPIHIDVPGGSLPGYFMQADTSEGPRPTLIAVNGGEMFAEDQYFWIGAAGLARGYNVLSFDGFGDQGFRCQWGQKPFPNPQDVAQFLLPAVDAALSRPATDPNRLAAIGFSGGGYRVLHMAAIEPRLKAVIADAPIISVYDISIKELPRALQNAPAFIGDTLVRLAGQIDPFSRVEMERMCWGFGVNRVSDLLEIFRQAGSVDPKRISAPLLCLAGEGESAEGRRQAQAVYDQSPSPHKTLRIFTRAEGADAHCQLNNLSLMQHTVFDWLDELFIR